MANVSFILFPEFQMLAYVLATETLRIANKCAGQNIFKWQTRTATNAPVQASNGAVIAPDTLDWSGQVDADLVVFCAGYGPLLYLTARVRAYAARAAAKPVVLGGIDTGTVILAELGLLNGSHAVLHHEAEAVFRERWPNIQVSDQIFSLHENRLTAAGGTATGDALLAWIARDVDATLATTTADALVHGGPRESATPQRTKTTADPVLLQMHRIMTENMSNPLSMSEISTRLNLSPKQLRQRCQSMYQMTPSDYDRVLRLETAHHLLTNSRLSISEVALSSGFNSLSSFSRTVRRHFGQPPTNIRKQRLTRAQSLSAESVSSSMV